MTTVDRPPEPRHPPQAALDPGQGTELDRLSRDPQAMRAKRLHTVCEEAACPNIGDCWTQGTPRS